MTSAQRSSLARLLAQLEVGELIHGDCLGADAEVHVLALERGARVHLRPCTIHDMRAFCEGAVSVAEPKPPLARNREIVDEGELLIAAPGMMKAQRRSGVWATIRYALARGREVHIVWPDGSVERRTQV